ncbi:MAG: pseudouridine synthase, partial [Rikenellaceae bacterium]
MDIRLNKFISDSGYCSRREADRFIEGGKVTLNRRVATLGDRVTSSADVVKVNGNLIEGVSSEDYVYIALNKPVGVTSTTDQADKTNVVDFINYPTRIFHIGRLDKDSEGLLLLTNNGDIVNKILRAGNDHEKEYEVWVDRAIEPNFAQRMSSGIKILGTVTKPCKVEVEGANKFR